MGSPGGDGVVTAAVLIIGDEILSGRTQDTNLRDIARYLGVHGVDLCEARTVPDIQDEIVDALNALRARYDYVITTGGIGPTHDDITADAVAAAFGVGLEEHPDILAMMQSRWGDQLNVARRRMARVPVGGSLVNNPVQGPPGFTIGKGAIAAPLEAVAKAHPSLSLGSYPFFTEGLYGSNLVLRSRDGAELAATVAELIAALRAAGIENVREVEAA
jgi:molybdenum cofactor synthesis domain-containing protein